MTDPGANSDVEEADVDDTAAPVVENKNKDKLFGNF